MLTWRLMLKVGTAMAWLILVLLLVALLLLCWSIQAHRIRDSNCSFVDLTRCSKPCGSFKLLISELSRCLFSSDSFVFLSSFFLALEVLQKVVKFLFWSKLFLLLLFVFFYIKFMIEFFLTLHWAIIWGMIVATASLTINESCSVAKDALWALIVLVTLLTTALTPSFFVGV